MGKCKTPLGEMLNIVLYFGFYLEPGGIFFLNSTLCLYTIKFTSFKDVD